MAGDADNSRSRRSAPATPSSRRPDRAVRADGTRGTGGTDRADGPVLPDRARDETEVGWGDEPSGRDDEWYRRERPPHHG